MFMEGIVARGSAHGLDPGDVVQAPRDDGLFRYLGARDGLPALDGVLGGSSDEEVLVFETGIPIMADLSSSDYSYLLIDSSSRPNDGDYHILDCTVEELHKYGNIPSQLWVSMRTWDRWILENAVLRPESNAPVTLWKGLEDHADMKKELATK
jgi:hypothetical protein